MIRILPAIALGCLACAPVGAAQTAAPQDDWGYGMPGDRSDAVSIGPVEALGLPPLMEADGDVFRFSSAPALGGRGYVVTLTELPRGAGRLDAEVVEGHPYLGWKRIGRVQAILSAERYAAARAELDRLYRPPSPDQHAEPPATGGEITICTDGPGYLSESRRGGDLTLLQGFCGPDHPNNAIARLMRQFAIEAGASLWRGAADEK